MLNWTETVQCQQSTVDVSMRPLDDSSFGWCDPWTTHPLDETFPGWHIHGLFNPSIHLSIYQFIPLRMTIFVIWGDREIQYGHRGIIVYFTKVYVPSSELGPPSPTLHASLPPPPPPPQVWGRHTRLGGGGGGPHSNEGTETLVLYVYNKPSTDVAYVGDQ